MSRKYISSNFHLWQRKCLRLFCVLLLSSYYFVTRYFQIAQWLLYILSLLFILLYSVATQTFSIFFLARNSDAVDCHRHSGLCDCAFGQLRNGSLFSRPAPQATDALKSAEIPPISQSPQFPYFFEGKVFKLLGLIGVFSSGVGEFAPLV